MLFLHFWSKFESFVLNLQLVSDTFRLSFGGCAGMHRNQVLPMHSDGFVEARGSFWITVRSLAGHSFFISAIPFRISGVSPGKF